MAHRYIHLPKRQNPADPDSTPTVCGTFTGWWSTDPQAVTCPRCISKIELQPA